MMTKFETNHDYGFNDEIENKSKFKKNAKSRFRNQNNEDQS